MQKGSVFQLGDAAVLLSLLFELEIKVEETFSDKSGRRIEGFPGKVFPGDRLLQTFESAGFSFDKAEAISKLLLDVTDYLQRETDLKPASAERGKNLEHLRNFISVVYSSLSKEAAIAITKNKVNRKLVHNDVGVKSFHTRLRVTEEAAVGWLNLAGGTRRVRDEEAGPLTVLTLCLRAKGGLELTGNRDDERAVVAQWVSAEERNTVNISVDPKRIGRYFKLYVVKDEGSEDKPASTTVKFWCFSSCIAMRALKMNGVRTVIVTSGTLSPLANFTRSIGL
ncbi:unnamed protein product [Heligmosomoides polygyrus]|uniref:Ppx-GppA domain-containing protein n=1 Tax=Heligmosomoides polygyrus TaxID=6339 RepID=A0A183GB65_HELPZ|nr:unnamed protein product [Heligmosomoides polygyrus]